MGMTGFAVLTVFTTGCSMGMTGFAVLTVSYCFVRESGTKRNGVMMFFVLAGSCGPFSLRVTNHH